MWNGPEWINFSRSYRESLIFNQLTSLCISSLILSPLFSESTRRARKKTWNRRRRAHTSSTMKMMSMTLMMTIFRQSILPSPLYIVTCGGLEDRYRKTFAVSINPQGRREGTAAILNKLFKRYITCNFFVRGERALI